MTGHIPVAYVFASADQAFDIDGQPYHYLAIATYSEQFDGLSWSQTDARVSQYTTRLPEAELTSRRFSRWFAPSVEDWQVFVESFGFAFSPDGSTVTEQNQGYVVSQVNEFFRLNGIVSSALNGPYWTSTSTNDNQAYYIDITPGRTVMIQPLDKTATKAGDQNMVLRPMIAFK